MSKPEINMIVCVAENNLIGDKNPTGNGLLWHSKEELAYYKELLGMLLSLEKILLNMFLLNL